MSTVDDINNSKEFASLLGCSVTPLHITYLGILLGSKANSKFIWNPIIERTRKKISSWKGRYLSKEGKLILLKRVLLILHIHFLSLFKTLTLIANQIERI